ncbi:HPF/RaiA family ribosome-associated protein [Croceicoccus ponticola]|uniref:HPF/RaiA family ribosome-associated protein n=1 Tax=Croceicoccus ponticola TaxID=2217664 RepID=A0A437H1R1_9SPHN|nr:HPF/RaiA family ribosome-associated protein [Croceicoccus ponticola]RVQ69584.1 HPF/RaiA family ribosome-associated protein [Croceicoccus ponticola]
MEVPVQIDLQGGEISDELRAHVRERVDALESVFNRIIAARVVIRPPSGRHRTGGQFGVNIHLSLPGGRHVDVDRSHDLDERHSHAMFAIDDAFKRVRRRLQDEVRRMQGAVKSHEEAPTAKVARIDPSGEYGFLEDADGSEVYFHRNALANGRMDDIEVGARVSFVPSQGDKGPQASLVKPLDRHHLRI